MAKDNPEFWSIAKASFPEAEHDHYVELKAQTERAEELDRRQLAIQNERLSRINQASKDPAIARYFLDGVGSEEALVAHLQCEHMLAGEEEAAAAIDLGIGRFGEVVGYDYEA